MIENTSMPEPWQSQPADLRVVSDLMEVEVSHILYVISLSICSLLLDNYWKFVTSAVELLELKIISEGFRNWKL